MKNVENKFFIWISMHMVAWRIMKNILGVVVLDMHGFRVIRSNISFDHEL